MCININDYSNVATMTNVCVKAMCVMKVNINVM